MEFASEGEWNEIKVTFEYPPDKWVGLDDWQGDVDLILTFAARLMRESRGEMFVTRRVAPPIEED